MLLCSIAKEEPLVLKMKISPSYIDCLATRQLNHLAGLAKWLSVRLRTKWLWV